MHGIGMVGLDFQNLPVHQLRILQAAGLVMFDGGFQGFGKGHLFWVSSGKTEFNL